MDRNSRARLITGLAGGLAASSGSAVFGSIATRALEMAEAATLKKQAISHDSRPRVIGGWKHSHAEPKQGKREMERRAKKVAKAQLRVHNGPPRVLHHHLPDSKAPGLDKNSHALAAFFSRARLNLPEHYTAAGEPLIGPWNARMRGTSPSGQRGSSMKGMGEAVGFDPNEVQIIDTLEEMLERHNLRNEWEELKRQSESYGLDARFHPRYSNTQMGFTASRGIVILDGDEVPPLEVPSPKESQ